MADSILIDERRPWILRQRLSIQSKGRVVTPAYAPGREEQRRHMHGHLKLSSSQHNGAFGWKRWRRRTKLERQAAAEKAIKA